MIDSVLKNVDTLKNDPKLNTLMSKTNLRILEEVHDLMAQFKTVRVSLCYDQQPALHTVILSQRILLKHIKTIDADSDLVGILKGRMKTELESTFRITPYHVIATVLNPKYLSAASFGDETVRDKFRELDKLDGSEEVANKVPYYDNVDDSMDSLFKGFADESMTVFKITNEIDRHK